MVFFWGAAALVAAKMERLRAAETALLELAVGRVRSSNRGGVPMVRTVDTKIPASSVISSMAAAAVSCLTGGTACEELLPEDDDCYVIHSIEVTSDSNNNKSADAKPLVLLHGYSKYRVYECVGFMTCPAF
jgi:hypothetical protein